MKTEPEYITRAYFNSAYYLVRAIGMFRRAQKRIRVILCKMPILYFCLSVLMLCFEPSGSAFTFIAYYGFVMLNLLNAARILSSKEVKQ